MISAPDGDYMDISLKNYKNFIAGRQKSGGMFHAMIIFGANDSDRERIVGDIASSIVCSGIGDKPCGVCPNCKKAREGIHPDIITLSVPNDKAEISVGQARELRAGVSVIPNDAANKVYIIDQADKMNTAAQNVLLKTLEEPPSFAYFILCAENPGLLLPTVRSRCAELRYNASVETVISEEASDAARSFIELTLQDDKFALMSYINSLGGTDKAVFYDISYGVRKNAARLLASSPSADAKQKLLKLIYTFETVSEYLDMNVSTVHILGLIMAELV